MGEGWQPIETAPKDGTWFLIWSPNNERAELAAINRKGELWLIQDHEPWGRDIAKGWTHWQPLPEPPNEP